ncbi:MAG: protoheme IX farnesyltransferase [Chlamydiales bacterium]|jgi:protoheme IX farnesyltransferase
MKSLVQDRATGDARALVLEGVDPVSQWAAMIRPRMALMVFFVTMAGGLIGHRYAPGTSSPWLRSAEAGLYLTLVTACASILNQVLERDTDALMERTRRRPLVTGTIAVRDALFFGLIAGTLGVVGLALSFQMLSGFLALATLVIYVGVYTPMKRVSTTNTVIGAIPGAAPPLIGFVALAGDTGPWAWVLFGVLFAWQFPHFMAIAWLYRADYSRAGMRMLPCIEDSKGVAGRYAVLYSLALIPVSLLPVMSGMAGPIYAIGATVLGLAYLLASIAFLLHEERRQARALMQVSLLYVPLLIILVLVDPSISAASLDALS